MIFVCASSAISNAQTTKHVFEKANVCKKIKFQIPLQNLGEKVIFT
jgi:hypothetical protein